jgi:hypothetical protein
MDVSKVLDGSQFHRILLWVVGFNELIFDNHIPMDSEDLCTAFFPGIISSECKRTTLFLDKITIDIRELAFTLHAINIYDMGFVTKENLCTVVTMEDASDIGKQGISRNDLSQPVVVEVWYPGFDVSPHGISDNHLGQLSGLFQGGFNDIYRTKT